jgi:DNA-binding transcriptional MerR regulator
MAHKTLAESSPSANTLRIDELARETGLTVRNIRAYHERGLLAAPELRARSGFYGPEHIARIALIQNLRDEGLKLEGIKRLLDASHSDSAHLLRVRDAAQAVDEVEAPEVMAQAVLRTRLGIADDEAAARFFSTAQRLGLLAPVAGGRYHVFSPALIDAAEVVVGSGMTLDHALELVEHVAGPSEAIARGFVQTFVDDVWKPFADAGMPAGDWPRVAEAMERTRSASTNVVLAVFRQRMAREVEATFLRITRQIADGSATASTSPGRARRPPSDRTR